MHARCLAKARRESQQQMEEARRRVAARQEDRARRPLPPDEVVRCPGHGGDRCGGAITIRWRRAASGLTYSYPSECSQFVRVVRRENDRLMWAAVDDQMRKEGQRKATLSLRERCGQAEHYNATAIRAASAMPQRRGLMLLGQPGGGKTSIALQALSRIVAGGERGMYMPESVLLAAWRRYVATRGDDRSANTVMWAVGYGGASPGMSWLLLDDYGSSSPTEAGREMIGDVLWRWLEGRRGLIVTSNHTARELYDRDERVMSRMLEHCGRPIEVRGDWRRAAVMGRGEERA